MTEVGMPGPRRDDEIIVVNSVIGVIDRHDAPLDVNRGYFSE